jgi:hypothetical protein
MMINLPHAAEIPAINGLDLSDSSIALLADMVFDEIIASPHFPSLSHSREALIRQASILVSQKLAGLADEESEDNDEIAFGRSDCEFIFRD